MFMSIKVRYFASLKERLGRSEQELVYSDGLTAGAVWLAATDGMELPRNILVAVNMDYASPDALVKDGDAVACFPPVTGG